MRRLLLPSVAERSSAGRYRAAATGSASGSSMDCWCVGTAAGNTLPVFPEASPEAPAPTSDRNLLFAVWLSSSPLIFLANDKLGFDRQFEGGQAHRFHRIRGRQPFEF